MARRTDTLEILFRLRPIGRNQALLCALSLSSALSAFGQDPRVLYKTGIESTYVHRINLLDKDGNLIWSDSKTPYSPARTCGKCHDYDRIGMGRHFQAGFPGVEDGRPGEPWILWEPVTSTQVALSHRAWAGEARRRPADFGMNDAEFAQKFAPHHPGGGVLEWLMDGRRRDAEDEATPPGGTATGSAPPPSWRAVGSLEIDCLQCHAASGYSTFERFYHVSRDPYYRGAPTVAAGLGVVRGSLQDLSRRREGSPDVTAGAPEGPVAVYDPARFDPDGKVTFDITRNPPDRNCLYCHGQRTPGAGDPAAPERDADVHHAMAGFSCTTCHRNDIGHEILRGDGDRKHHPGGETLTCKGCHEIGRLGAPGIEHPGMPAFHLEKLSCTACHSGPLPQATLGNVQTARAHGLGVVTFANLDEKNRPAIQAPFYKPGPDGVIRPHAALWEAWWAERKDGKLVPVPLQDVSAAMGEARGRLEAEARAKGESAAAGKTPEEKFKAGEDAVTAFREDWARRPEEDRRRTETPRVLDFLKEKRGSEAVYIAGGRTYRSEGGALAVTESPDAEPYSWPLAHPVRPAGQALGAKGCSDCHSSGSSFFFGVPAGTPPGPDGGGVTEPMTKYLGLKQKAVKLGAAAVRAREWGVKRIALWIVLGVLGLAFVHAFAGARRPATVPAAEVPFGPFLRAIHTGAFGLFLLLAATGLGFILVYGPDPIPGLFSARAAVKVHDAAGIAFAALSVLLALAWFGGGRTRAAEWLAGWGGFLWKGGGRAATGWARLWVWHDLLCCLALAGSGVLMWLRDPAVASRLGAGLRHFAEHPYLSPLAFALHGVAGTAMLVRLAVWAYYRWAPKRAQ